MYETFEQHQQTALLVAVDTGLYDVEISLCELEELAGTAGARIMGKAVQKRPDFDPATCIGQGRLEEIRSFCKDNQVDLLIFDHELSGSQIRNIEAITGVETIDRTMLILDIFAQRAKTGAGRLQVELAQQKYLLPRLTGKGTSLSRLGGGIGTRGPGETKLESDRRHIRRRIETLEKQLDTLERRRDLIHKRRKKDGITSVAIVGYTNVGKSTLLNALTDAGVLAEDKLFATLDPTARALVLPDGRSVMLVDTVGLVRRLPHHLVEAFHSTLEEAVQADLLLNVCDASSPEMPEQVEVTQALMEQLGASGTPVVTVLNKCDLIDTPPVPANDRVALISAKTGFGFDELLRKICVNLPPTQTRLTLLIPYAQGALAAEIRTDGKILSESFMPDGILTDALVDRKLLHKVQDYVYHP